MTYDLVDKYSYAVDPYHAPYETIEAETTGKARKAYVKLHPDSKFVDILCRKSRKHSYNI
jgi:hypothetical protein